MGVILSRNLRLYSKPTIAVIYEIIFRKMHYIRQLVTKYLLCENIRLYGIIKITERVACYIIVATAGWLDPSL